MNQQLLLEELTAAHWGPPSPDSIGETESALQQIVLFEDVSAWLFHLESQALVHPFRDLGTLPCQEGAAGATEGLFGASQLQN